MAQKKYRPKTITAKLGWLVEECGEVQAAVGKTLRHGLENTNPDLPPDEQETNRQWVLRELQDLKKAMALVEEALQEKPPIHSVPPFAALIEARLQERRLFLVLLTRPASNACRVLFRDRNDVYSTLTVEVSAGADNLEQALDAAFARALDAHLHMQESP